MRLRRQGIKVFLFTTTFEKNSKIPFLLFVTIKNIMENTTENQFNVQWDVLQGNNSSAEIDPLSDILNDNEPAILTSQSV